MASEAVTWNDQLQGFSPPAGTVAVGASGIPDLASMDMAAQDALPNPVAPSLDSLKNGELTPAQLRELLLMIAPYAGYPRAAALVGPIENAIAEFEKESK